MLTLFTFLPSIPLLAFLNQRRHLLMALLSLEATALILALLALIMSPQTLLLVLCILTFSACEASLGLSLLVAMSRQYGNDHLNTLQINKW